jgi:hypothetical protein
MKELQAPFIPKVQDLETIRKNNSLVNFKDLKETVIPT